MIEKDNRKAKADIEKVNLALKTYIINGLSAHPDLLDNIIEKMELTKEQFISIMNDDSTNFSVLYEISMIISSNDKEPLIFKGK